MLLALLGRVGRGGTAGGRRGGLGAPPPTRVTPPRQALTSGAPRRTTHRVAAASCTDAVAAAAEQRASGRPSRNAEARTTSRRREVRTSAHGEEPPGMSRARRRARAHRSLARGSSVGSSAYSILRPVPIPPCPPCPSPKLLSQSPPRPQATTARARESPRRPGFARSLSLARRSHGEGERNRERYPSPRQTSSRYGRQFERATISPPSASTLGNAAWPCGSRWPSIAGFGYLYASITPSLRHRIKSLMHHPSQAVLHRRPSIANDGLLAAVRRRAIASRRHRRSGRRRRDGAVGTTAVKRGAETATTPPLRRRFVVQGRRRRAPRRHRGETVRAHEAAARRTTPRCDK